MNQRRFPTVDLMRRWLPLQTRQSVMLWQPPALADAPWWAAQFSQLARFVDDIVCQLKNEQYIFFTILIVATLFDDFHLATQICRICRKRHFGGAFWASRWRGSSGSFTLEGPPGSFTLERLPEQSLLKSSRQARQQDIFFFKSNPNVNEKIKKLRQFWITNRIANTFRNIT